MRCPNIFTFGLLAFSVASLPSSTSVIPPIAASMTKDASALLAFVSALVSAFVSVLVSAWPGVTVRPGVAGVGGVDGVDGTPPGLCAPTSTPQEIMAAATIVDLY